MMRQDFQVSEALDRDGPLYQRIVYALAAEVAAEKIGPGTRLLESRIATRFGVSRAPARQALAALQTLGIVTQAAAPARGYLVSETAAQIAQSYASDAPEPFCAQTIPTWQLIYRDVEETLSQRIAFGSWRLVETALGHHYGVSRTVAREVLARLQSSGLVLNEGRGWVAPQLTETRVRDLYDLRALLEPAALAEVGRNAPLDLIDSMIEDLHNALRGTPDSAMLDTLETDLHFKLLHRCTNAMLRKAMNESQSLLLAHRFFYKVTTEIYPVEPFLDEHIDILTTLRSGAISEACEKLRSHLNASHDRAIIRIANIRGTLQHQPLSYLDPIGVVN